MNDSQDEFQRILLSGNQTYMSVIQNCSCSRSAAYQYRSAAYLALSSKGSQYHPVASPRGILFGQWKGPLRGRVCGGRVACVAGDGFEVRYAENVLEVEGLGSGWLGDGDSFISRNPPWLRPWTVPGSTLWGFPRCLALKNPPAVPLGTLEKCGNSWPGGGYDGTGSNPCFCQKWRQI
ncbi:hypothetical protein TNCT_527011 [Trichonephila clavata]|uniref:Uncharacterized protein n=1 Tax=Trichonephila clavata TaxID=2740835 RepID=A0A8X6HRW0_TRICU|nr:hypothetical protein TNCT_527011 [Trichonephila clavata]